jgi:hypothetical protein
MDMSAGPWGFAGGSWWRFSRYEIRDGYLRPAPEAQLERYNPLEAHRRLREGRSDSEAPYVSLLAVLRDLKLAPMGYGAEAPYALTPESQISLVEWCGQHGLLGLLLHQTYRVELAPRWQETHAGSQLPDRLIPVSTYYARDAFGWVERSDVWWRKRIPDAVLKDARAGGLVPADLLPEDWSPPQVLLGALDHVEWRTEPLGATWGRFFPDVPSEERETHAYPQPCTDAFWKSYAEPLEVFLHGAAVLRDAVVSLSRPEPEPENEDQEGPEFVAGIVKGTEALLSLLSGVTPGLIPLPKGRYLPTWASGSLLGAFAMMAYLDLTERRRVFSCARCGRIFTSQAYQARYCSNRCRYVVQKHAYRERVRKRTEISQDQDRTK